jgi:hypothetical protein
MHIPYSGDTGGDCWPGLKRGPWRCAVTDYEELLRIKIVHGEKRRWPRRPDSGRCFWWLAVLPAAFPAWACAASVVIASASALTLDGAQHSATLNVDAAHGAALRQIAQGQPASLPGDPASYRSASLVLDDVTLTAAGARGGYFYKIYLAPAGAAPVQSQHLLGTLGPFEIAAARQRGATSLQYALGNVDAAGGSPLVVLFQRAGGADGALIRIGGLRVELSTGPGS